MLPDRVSNPGPLTYESGALPIALRGPAEDGCMTRFHVLFNSFSAVSGQWEAVCTLVGSVQYACPVVPLCIVGASLSQYVWN